MIAYLYPLRIFSLDALVVISRYMLKGSFELGKAIDRKHKIQHASSN
jgi:hypothetical protein